MFGAIVANYYEDAADAIVPMVYMDFADAIVPMAHMMSVRIA